MKKMIFFLIFSPCILSANNIKISNISIAGQNTIEKTYNIRFDLGWENSWRTSDYESNWDAAWVFIKYTKKNHGHWQHAGLQYVDGINDGHVAPNGCLIETKKNSYGENEFGVGAMVYRAEDGIGDVDYEHIELVWNYSKTDIADDDKLQISIQAIEMVYVPEGAFYVGDGSFAPGSLRAGYTDDPFLISSTGNIILGGNNPTALGNYEVSDQEYSDDFDYEASRVLPASYPNGYESFYCMKYETSQAQYAAFLSQLIFTQRIPRGGPHLVDMVDEFPIQSDEYYAIADEPARAMNWINWDDAAAYLDWCGLRPMSELEFEKACRGPKEPIPSEFAWGSATDYGGVPFSIIHAFTDQELVTTKIVKHSANMNWQNGYIGTNYPLRSGIFAAGSDIKNRIYAGATYWGILEMTGNAAEVLINIGHQEGRNYTGLHGDGKITNIGEHDQELKLDWGGEAGNGVGRRLTRVSNRFYSNSLPENRNRWYGFRGIRSAD